MTNVLHWLAAIAGVGAAALTVYEASLPVFGLDSLVLVFIAWWPAAFAWGLSMIAAALTGIIAAS